MDSTESAPAPQSTQEIAASVIESADQQDTSTGDAPPTVDGAARLDTRSTAEAPPATAPPKTEPTPAEISAAEKFLEKQGHKLKKEDGREVWLPAKTVEKMLDRYVEEHRATWTGERTTLESRATELQQHLDALRTSVAGDPKAFLSELAGIDPRYAAFLEQKVAARQALPAAESDPMPAPDYPLGDGRFTYSDTGLRALRDWDKRQIKRELAAEMDERFKPIAEREKAEQQRAHEARILDGVRTRTAEQLDEAQTWPLFGTLAADGTYTEFQTAVLTELQNDSNAARARGWNPEDARTVHLAPRLSLEGAYIRIAGKRMTEDENTKRDRLLKEFNDAPKATATGRQPTDAPRRQAPRSTAEITRQTIAKLENAG